MEMGKRSLTSYYYAFFALIMLIVSWESNLASAALLTPSIPEESIRIRILANSDSVEDQWIKKEIREAIVENINGWQQSYSGIEDARKKVRARLPELERIAGKLLKRYGYAYGYKVELGRVYFPAKVFGTETYPAGEYEAVRITLGAGKGENWWCVLFPPLCFGNGAVKAAETDKPTKEDKQDSEAIVEKKTIANKQTDESARSDQQGNRTAEIADDKKTYLAPTQTGKEVEVRFFFADAGKKVGSFFKKLFS